MLAPAEKTSKKTAGAKALKSSRQSDTRDRIDKRRRPLYLIALTGMCPETHPMSQVPILSIPGSSLDSLECNQINRATSP